MPPLEIARLALLVTHFVGLAVLVGPFLLQLRREEPRLRLMLSGAIAQVVTGNALIASRQLQGLEVDEAKVIVKLGLGLVALGALIAGTLVQRRQGAAAAAGRTLFRGAGLSGLVAIVIAVVWT